MTTTTTYQILESRDRVFLEAAVNAALTNGWDLIGGVCHSFEAGVGGASLASHYAQAMVRKK